MPGTYGIQVYDQLGALGPQQAATLGLCLFADEVDRYEAFTITGLDTSKSFLLYYVQPFNGVQTSFFDAAKYNAGTKTYTEPSFNTGVDGTYTVICFQWDV